VPHDQCKKNRIADDQTTKRLSRLVEALRWQHGWHGSSDMYSQAHALV
jgi:hypothetical protein